MEESRTLAPIALFVYARPAHTRQTVEALARNDLAAHSDLIIFADGCRGDEDRAAVDEVRRYLKTVSGFRSVTVHERERNFGLADNIVDGVTQEVNRRGAVIVLEDDIVTSRYFLRYMNDGLQKYAGSQNIMHIGGYMFPASFPPGVPETFFLRQSFCWGWATWARAWKYFRKDGRELIEKFGAEDIRCFNMQGAYDYWRQLTENEEGRLKTWAVYWYASVYRRNGLGLYPRESLVHNIGFDGTGENCAPQERLRRSASDHAVEHFPKKIEEHKQAAEAIALFLKGEFRGKLFHLYEMLKKGLRSLKQSGVFLRANHVITRISAAYRFRGVTFGRNVQLTGAAGMEIGPGSCIGDNVWLNTNIRGQGCTLKIGRSVLIGRNSICSSCSTLEVGDYTFTNGCVIISNALHPYTNIEQRYIEGVADRGPMVIEENCWISFGAAVYGGITVGRGSIIGANCVVTADVPPFSVVVGNPQKTVKMYNPRTAVWEDTHTPEDIARVMADREACGLPDRDEYRELLQSKGGAAQVHPLCAGRGIWV